MGNKNIPCKQNTQYPNTQCQVRVKKNLIPNTLFPIKTAQNRYIAYLREYAASLPGLLAQSQLQSGQT